jgi:hypothetical protein
MYSRHACDDTSTADMHVKIHEHVRGMGEADLDQVKIVYRLRSRRADGGDAPVDLYNVAKLPVDDCAPAHKLGIKHQVLHGKADLLQVLLGVVVGTPLPRHNLVLRARKQVKGWGLETWRENCCVLRLRLMMLYR